MQMNKQKIVLPAVLIFIILFIGRGMSMQKTMNPIPKEVKKEMEITQTPRLQLALTDTNGKVKRFRLGEPLSVSREVYFKGETRSPNAFHLTPITSKTVEFEGQFIGDVSRGGSCNVDTLQYVPHGLTHLETSAHILGPEAHPPTVKDIPVEKLSGIVFLIDLSQPGEESAQLVPRAAVQAKLEQNTLPISLLAIKTRASLLPQDYDFSGKNFLALAPGTAKGIHDYTVCSSRIQCLILDLPSIDPEKDGGKLLAHRHFFGLPETGTNAGDKEKRALVELAWFANLTEGYYYAVITPPRFETNAVTTGIVFRPLIEIK
jgi:kynurenine formamidase